MPYGIHAISTAWMYVGLLAIWLPGILAAGAMAALVASLASAVLLSSVRAACNGNLDHLILMQLSASKTVRGPTLRGDVWQCAHPALVTVLQQPIGAA